MDNALHFSRRSLMIGGAALLWAPPAFARAPRPPVETGTFRDTDLVELIKLDPTFKLDIRYATRNNFTGRVMYRQARAFLQRPAAEALVRAHARAKQAGYGMLIFDGYRPWDVTRYFWDVTPRSKHNFVANPKKGSKHNRGCAIDLSLFDLKTGAEITMPSPYDSFTASAAAYYAGGTDAERKTRDFLREIMVAEGFLVNSDEWWHFDYKDWQQYRIGNVPFEKI